MKLMLKKGVTSQTVLIKVYDSSVTTGAGLTGLAYNSSGLSAYYYREGQGTGGTSITLATATLGTWTSGGFVEVDSTNMPGWYEVGIPDAALASGADFVGLQLKGATNMVPVDLEIELVAVDLSDGVRFGLTALPNAAADAAGGLPISAAGGLDLDAILVDTNSLNDTKIPDTISLAAINAQVDTALTDIGLDHLLAASVTGTDVTDNSIIAKLVSASATADWDDFVNTTDSLQALRDRGDAAWVTGAGGSIPGIIAWEFDIPTAVDLANTATYRVAIHVTDAYDDLPTTGEITPGTVEIHRKAQGGTAWANPTGYSGAQAMSEAAGQIYFDFVVSTANGFAAGDMLRFSFLGQLVTISANDYVICDGTTATLKYSGIIADTPDVNIASINGSTANVAAMNLFFSIVNAGTGQLDSGSFAADAITASAIQDGSFTSAKFADSYLTAAKIAADALTAAKLASDVTTELQSGLATSAEISAVDAKIDTIDANVDSVLEDTGTTLPGLIGTPVADLATDIAGVQTAVDALPSVSDFLTTQMTESYAAQGVAPTLAQALFGIYQQMNESARVGTTVTVKKLDQSTAAYTLTLSDATNPASVTRAT